MGYHFHIPCSAGHAGYYCLPVTTVWRETDVRPCAGGEQTADRVMSRLLSYSLAAALCLRLMAGALTGTGLELVYVLWDAATLGRQAKAVWQETPDFYL